MRLLSKRITSHLQKIVGQKLKDVDLFCFDYEIDPPAMENLPFYFGNELVLNFEKDIAIITWDENAGWREHFSLYVGCERLYLPISSLIKWNVSKLKPWQNCIDRELTFTRIYSQNQTPHVVKLNFADTVIFVGDSSENRFGDGDDLLITNELLDNDYGKWNMIWEVKDT